MDPVFVQTGIAGPLMVALIAYTSVRRDRTGLHRILMWLLVMVLLWMTGMLLGRFEAAPRWLRMALTVPPVCFMSPLFVLLMLRYGRVGFVADRRAAEWALMLPFALFMPLWLSNDYHGWMIDPAENFHGEAGVSEAGPLFWAFQIWSVTVAAGGLALCGWLAWTRSGATRRCMALLTAGVCFPLASHMISMLWPELIGFPLTPSSLALTCVLVVIAIERFRLLDVQPLARHDVVESSSDAVIVADSEEAMVDLNPAARELLGLGRGAVEGWTLADLPGHFGRTEPPDAVEGLLAALRSGPGPVRVEFRTESGRTLEMSGGRPNDPDGVLAGYFVVLRDRSGERRAEQMLYHSQKLESMGILAAGVAHEVNNPLAFVRSNFAYLGQVATVVEDRLDELPKELAESMHDMPEVIEDSVAGLERIHGVVQGLLRFSRMPGSGRADFDVNESVAEALRFAALGPNGGVAIESELAPGLPPVHGVEDQLVQVLLNLFLNAKKAVEGWPVPRIRTTTRLVDGQIEIRVEDNGPGVPAAIRDKIFDPFFTTGAPNEGTGLGLAIAFDIVRAHGGLLEYEAPEGGGARFVVRLPVPLRSEPREGGPAPG